MVPGENLKGEIGMLPGEQPVVTLPVTPLDIRGHFTALEDGIDVLEMALTRTDDLDPTWVDEFTDDCGVLADKLRVVRRVVRSRLH